MAGKAHTADEIKKCMKSNHHRSGAGDYHVDGKLLIRHPSLRIVVAAEVHIKV